MEGLDKNGPTLETVQKRKPELRRVVFGNFAHLPGEFISPQGRVHSDTSRHFQLGAAVSVEEEIGGSRAPNQIDYAKCSCPSDKIGPQCFVFPKEPSNPLSFNLRQDEV